MKKGLENACGVSKAIFYSIKFPSVKMGHRSVRRRSGVPKSKYSFR